MADFKFMIDDERGNKVLGLPEPYPKSIKISFLGKNNTIDFRGCDVSKLKSADFTVKGDGSSLVIGKVRKVGHLRVTMRDGAEITIADDVSFEDVYLLATNGKSISIGRDCMFSFRVVLRTTDAHGIYDLGSGDVINAPGNITIGNHVWLGQAVIVAKDTVLEDNTIVGAMSYVRKIKGQPNTIIVGVPAKVVRENVIWDRRMTENIFDDEADLDPLFKKWLHNG